MKLNETARNNLEAEVSRYRGEAQELRKQIYQLEKERERYSLEAAEQAHLHLQSA